MPLKDLLLCASFAVALPAGQAMFKWAAITHARLHGDLASRLLHNFPLMGAFAWYGASSLLWFYILTRVPLSAAYPVAIMGSGLVPLVAWWLFKEPLSWRFLVGYGLMLLGFLVIARQTPA
jgi:multidrug transporter EmrE-like cation transporter